MLILKAVLAFLIYSVQDIVYKIIPTSRRTYRFIASTTLRPNVHQYTECRGRVVNIPASYSEFPSSSIDQETGYPDQAFRDFPQSVQVNDGTVPWIRSWPLHILSD
jgi:hypothetical protein